MRARTVIVSALIHLVVFGVALRISAGRSQRRATAIAVVKDEKKKEEKKKEPPKPKTVVASARTELPRALAPRATAPVPEAAAPAAAPVETGLELGNDDGPGIAIGGPAPAAASKGPATPVGEKRAVAVKKEKAAVARDNPEEDTCNEAPSKPVPVQRANEIEYTQEARANGVEGRLVLKITVGADGAVVGVEVVSSVDAQLDAAAIAAVKTWVFKPAMRCGRAMGGAVFTLARRFELGD